MSYRIGLVGKPSVGKSTLFNAATMNDVPEGAYPFTTIDPSVGEAYVRVDCAAPEFDETCTPSVGYCDDGTRFVPVKLVDVAGLIPGAHEGNGLGNQFLSDLNETDVLVHVVDFSGETDIEGEATENHDPREDIAFLENEVDMWYLDVLEKGIERHLTGYHGGEGDVEAALAEQMDAFGIVEEEIKQIILAQDIGFDPEAWDDEQREELAREIRKRTKPVVIAANKMDTPEAQENWAEITSEDQYDHLDFVPVSAHAEKSLKKAADAGVVDYTPGDDDFDIAGDVNESENSRAAEQSASRSVDVSDEQERGLEQIREFVTEYDGTGVQDVLETALFDTLDCVAVFPGSANGSKDEKGVFRDCFVLPENATVEDFAYTLHSDIGDGLLHGIDCRSQRQVGTNHELADCDVVEIITTG